MRWRDHVTDEWGLTRAVQKLNKYLKINAAIISEKPYDRGLT